MGITGAEISLFKIIFSALSTYGLPAIIALVTFLFALYVTYKVLMKKGIIGNSVMKINFGPILTELNKINSTLKSNGKILDLVLERQRGYLTEDQSYYVINSLIDSLITEILRKVMEIYVSNNIDKYEDNIRQALTSEMETMIKDYHRDSELIPNLINYTKPLKEQIKIVPDVVNNIINIIKNEKIEREAARKCKSIISTSIKNNFIV